MNLERITSPLHPLYKQALELYQISFPFHEQREAFSQAAILHDDAYHFDLIYDAGTFVGLVLYWESLDYPDAATVSHSTRLLCLVYR